jgi:hypothetical protein
MKALNRMSLTYFLDIMTYYGSCRNLGNVLFFYSIGSSSSSSSKSIRIWTFGFFVVGAELGPTPSSWLFLFRSSGGKT